MEYFQTINLRFSPKENQFFRAVKKELETKIGARMGNTAFFNICVNVCRTNIDKFNIYDPKTT